MVPAPMSCLVPSPMPSHAQILTHLSLQPTIHSHFTDKLTETQVSYIQLAEGTTGSHTEHSLPKDYALNHSQSRLYYT